MELTIALCVAPNSEEEKIIETLDSLPWDQEGVDLVIYSEDTGRIKRIIKEADLEDTLLSGEMEVLFCESPFSSMTLYRNIGLEDAKTDYITFLEPGDCITYFDQDLLREDFSIGLPGYGDLPVAYSCWECRMFPISLSGVIFRTNHLKETGLPIDDTILPILLKGLKDVDYCYGWMHYDISDSFTIIPNSDPDLTAEESIPDTLINLWKSGILGSSPYIRDLLWGRINTAAGNMVVNYQGKTPSKYYKYLFPTNKLEILN